MATVSELASAVVCRVSAETVITLRHQVLRAGLPIEKASFTGDTESTTRHYALLFDDKPRHPPIVCVTYMTSSWQGEMAWRLRGMATDPRYQGRGLGSRIVQFAERDLLQDSAIRLFWCDARRGAVCFYQKLGWETVGQEFDIEDAGPHIKMIKRIS